MTVITASFRTIEGTEAAEGVSGGGTVVVDRPDGVAGGRGLGFNGGELLALAVGGCLCNDLRYVAHRRGATLAEFTVDVEVHVDAHGSVERVSAHVAGDGQRDAMAALLDEATEGSTIVNAVKHGASVDVELR